MTSSTAPRLARRRRLRTVVEYRVATVCGITAFLGLIFTTSACHHAGPPNIILYVVDTLRADALDCDGNPHVRTPAFDRLAAAGMRFERAYANASWTRASMGSLLSGEFPTTHGAVGRMDVLRRGLPRLPALLRQRGYRTAAIIANPNVGRVFGFAEGFDEFSELYEGEAQVRPILPQELMATSDRVVDDAVDWLKNNTSTPFFLLVFAVDPHAPYTPPPPYDKVYDPDYAGNIDGSLKSMLGLGVFGPQPPEREIRHLRALYDGEVAFTDVQLGRLLDALGTLALSDDTVFVATSDHGEEFYEHGGRDHGHSLFEELIHVPLIVRWPGKIAAGSYGEPVQLVDLFPSLLRLAGGNVPESAGRDLSGVLLSHGRVEPEIYAELDLEPHHLRALMHSDQKLIVEPATSQGHQYQLDTDPFEQHPEPWNPTSAMADRIHELARLALERRQFSTPAPAQTALPDSARRAMEALGYLGRTPDP